MSKRVIIRIGTAAAAAVVLAIVSGVATSSSAASTSTTAAKLRVVPIVMADPGCHWFRVAGKNKIRLAVKGKTAFRNLDEDALVFKGKSFLRRVAVGKTLAIAKPGIYRITMVGQHPGDNVLKLVVK